MKLLMEGEASHNPRSTVVVGLRKRISGVIDVEAWDLNQGEKNPQPLIRLYPDGRVVRLKDRRHPGAFSPFQEDLDRKVLLGDEKFLVEAQEPEPERAQDQAETHRNRGRSSDQGRREGRGRVGSRPKGKR